MRPWILILLIALSVGTTLAQDKSTFRTRRDRVIQAAPDALVLVRSRSTVMVENEDGFRQNAFFYYLTGLENAVGALLVIDSPRHESWLFVPSPG